MKQLTQPLSLLLMVLALAWPNAAGAQSQATTAEVNGRVVDAQGGVLPGVTVTVKSPSTSYERTVTTNEAGLFSLPLLPPGEYDLTLELPGFNTGTRKVILTVGSTVTANHTMSVTGVTETVVVEAATPQIETTSTVRTTTIGAQAIGNLPINGRRFQDFITLTPTVQVDTSRGQLSFAGQRGVNGNVSVDGADYNQPFFGGVRGGERSNNAFTIPMESIQEFQVVAAGYSAEFGRSTGGLVNAITKSGSNDTKGSLFYVNRNKDWADKNAFGQNAAPTQQQFGGSIGGPLVQGKLFYFGAIEFQRLKNTRNVVFSLTGINPDATTQEAYTYFKNEEKPFDATNDADALLGRIDYQLNPNNRLNVRYNFSRNVAENSNATGNALSDTTISAISNNGTERDRTNTVVGQYTSVLSPNLLLEARGVYTRENRPRDANAQRPLVTGTVGNIGTVSFLGQNFETDWRTQAAANLTWLKGKHTFKGGTEWIHDYATQKFGFNQFGTWTVSGTSATMLEVLSLGGPNPNRFDVGSGVANYQRQLGNLEATMASNATAFFAQDTWKLAPSFTLNYGLRWEGQLNPTPEANNDYMLNALNGYVFPSGRSLDPTQIPDALNQWGPRVGFAWDPTKDGKTVVRGYSGVYYARTPMLIYAAPLNNFRLPPGDVSVRLPFPVPAGNPNTTLYQQMKLIGIDLNTYTLENLPDVTPDQISQIAAALGVNPNPYAGVQVIGVDKDFKNPRSIQGGAGVQREVLRDLTVSADVLYVKTDFLQRNFDLNVGIPTPRASDPAQRPIFPARPLTALQSVQVRESTASSEYTGLTLTGQLRKRWATFDANYTLSKSMSDDDNERDSGGVQYENAYDLGPEWSPARLDRRHIFNGYAMFFLPYHFDVTAGYRFLSALPIDAAFGRDINNSLGGPDRPYSAPGVPFERNAFRNEPFKEVSLKVQWGVEFAGTRKLMLTAEVFNLFNWDNIQLSGATVTNYCTGTAPDDCGFGAPTNPNFLSLKDNNPSSSTFGQLIQTNAPGAPRQVQLGVRFLF
jgi:hypothetical protein